MVSKKYYPPKKKLTYGDFFVGLIQKPIIFVACIEPFLMIDLNFQMLNVRYMFIIGNVDKTAYTSTFTLLNQDRHENDQTC